MPRPTMSFLLSLLALIFCSSCEEWFMPNSRLISDKEFKEKVIEDHSTYKLVKFFTPNCVYCRYLKNIIDKLKQEKQWNFQMYEVNCAWYPAFCTHEVKATSFPYTVIYDHNGEVDNQVVGFYPEQVFRNIFEQIEAANDLIKQRTNSNLNHQPPQAVTPQIQEEANHRSQPNDLLPPRPASLPDPTPQPPQEKKQATQPKIINKQNQHSKVDSSQVHDKQKVIQPPAHLSGAYQHIFFAICILLGVVYFGNFMHYVKPHTRIIHNPETAAEPFRKQQQLKQKITEKK